MNLEERVDWHTLRLNGIEQRYDHLFYGGDRLLFGRREGLIPRMDVLEDETNEALKVYAERIKALEVNHGKEVKQMKRVVLVLFLMWVLLVVGLTTAAIVEKVKAKHVTVSIHRGPETPTPEQPAPGPSQPGNDGPCPNKQECGNA